MAQDAGGGRLDLDRDLVGLDLDDGLAFRTLSPGAFIQRRTLPVSCAAPARA